MKNEKKFRIKHPNGSETKFGASETGKSKPEFISEEQLLAFLKEFSFPFKPQKIEIIGFGGYSVALRISLSEPRNVSFVGVLRDVDASHGLPLDPNNRILQETFAEFAIDQWSVQLADAQGHRYSLKLAPEVQGATLRDVSLLHILSNPKLLRQFGDFCADAITFFLKTKMLPDFVGHSQRGVSFIPFLSSNVMVEFGTNDLKFIDTDVLEQNKYYKATILKKIVLLTRMFSIDIAGLLAHKIAELIDEQIEAVQIEEKSEAEFIQGLREVIAVLDERGVNYRVLGSAAVAGFFEEVDIEYALTSTRSDGTKRDIDILILDADRETVRSLQTEFSQKEEKDQYFPEVSISSPLLPVSNPDTIFQKILPRITSRLRASADGGYEQVHGSLSMHISQEELSARRVSYKGVEFATIDPNVFLGLVLTRNAVIKFKDLKKYELFFQTVANQIPKKYLDFSRKIRTVHRREYKNFLRRQWISIFTRGVFDGFLTKKFYGSKK